MAQMLLLNPRRRRAAKRKAKPANKSAATPRRRAKRRATPISAAPLRRRARARRKNPITARRRRNPIRAGGTAGRSILSQLKAAAVGGAGAVGVELLMGYVSPMLPESLRRQAGKIGVGDAVKAGLTVMLGSIVGKRVPIVREMAAGALVVQAASMIRTLLPSSMSLGYYSPARLVPGNARVGPNQAKFAAYAPGARSPLLSAGSGTMLSGSRGMSARERDGVNLR